MRSTTFELLTVRHIFHQYLIIFIITVYFLYPCLRKKYKYIYTYKHTYMPMCAKQPTTERIKQLSTNVQSSLHLKYLRDTLLCISPITGYLLPSHTTMESSPELRSVSGNLISPYYRAPSVQRYTRIDLETQIFPRIESYVSAAICAASIFDTPHWVNTSSPPSVSTTRTDRCFTALLHCAAKWSMRLHL